MGEEDEAIAAMEWERADGVSNDGLRAAGGIIVKGELEEDDEDDEDDEREAATVTGDGKEGPEMEARDEAEEKAGKPDNMRPREKDEDEEEKAFEAVAEGDES